MLKPDARDLRLALALLVTAGLAAAQAPTAEPRELAIVEIGGAASHSLDGGGSAAGLDFAVEWTPIEHWLELEAGTKFLSNITSRRGSVPGFQMLCSRSCEFDRRVLSGEDLRGLVSRHCVFRAIPLGFPCQGIEVSVHVHPMRLR